MAGQILIATETVLTRFEGENVYIYAGQTTAREGHPILKGREDMFIPVQVIYDLPEPEPEPEPKPAARTAAKKTGAGQ